jgi:hypothetical protein
MQFQLTIDLDQGEAREAGATQAVPVYLAQVAAVVADGARAGILRDGNGVVVATYAITDPDCAEDPGCHGNHGPDYH